MKIKGLKSAVGDYKSANKEGYYSSRYGRLMFDRGSGEIWTDEFYSLSHNDWKEYHSDTIVNLGQIMAERGLEINMRNVKEFIHSNYEGYDD